MATAIAKTEEIPKTPQELLADVLAAARTIIAHCRTAPKGPRLAYSVDVGLVEELDVALVEYGES